MKVILGFIICGLLYTTQIYNGVTMETTHLIYEDEARTELIDIIVTKEATNAK